MEFSIERSSLRNGLSLVQGVVERPTTMPILGSVLIEAEGDLVKLAATDLEVGIRAELSAQVAGSGVITAPARKLWEIVQETEGDTLRIRELDGEQIEVRCGRAVFKMMSLDPRSFPAMPSGIESAHRAERTTGKALSPSALKLRPRILRQMIERVLFSASQDESRYALTGVFVESPSPGVARFVTTDGHRLASIEREASGFALERGVILPRKGVSQIDKLIAFSSEGGRSRRTRDISENHDGDAAQSQAQSTSGADDVELMIEPRLAYLKCGSAQLSMRLVEGEFPDYRAVIPKSTRHQIKVNHELLAAAVKRAAIFSNERFHGVKFHLSGAELTVSSITPGLGEASDVIDVEFSGDEFSIGFNSNYLLQMLAVVPEDSVVTLGLTDEVSPALITVENDSGYFYVVMPMRL
jgi:DNA polymerase-3 subunit beta